MKARPASDGDLETRVRALLGAGDLDGAVTAVLAALGPEVLHRLRRMLGAGCGDDAFSRFQEDVWRGVKDFQWRCALRPWVHRVAWHAAARVVRDRYRCRRRPLPSHLESAVAAPASDSGLGGRRDRLARLRVELPSEERSLIDLRVRHELQWDELSALLAAQGEAVTAATLRKRYERLTRKLATLARERGYVA